MSPLLKFEHGIFQLLARDFSRDLYIEFFWTRNKINFNVYGITKLTADNGYNSSGKIKKQCPKGGWVCAGHNPCIRH